MDNGQWTFIFPFLRITWASKVCKNVSNLRYGQAEQVDWDVSERLAAAALLSLTEVPCLTKALCSSEGWSLSEALEAQ